MYSILHIFLFPYISAVRPGLLRDHWSAMMGSWGCNPSGMHTASTSYAPIRNLHPANLNHHRQILMLWSNINVELLFLPKPLILKVNITHLAWSMIVLIRCICSSCPPLTHTSPLRWLTCHTHDYQYWQWSFHARMCTRALCGGAGASMDLASCCRMCVHCTKGLICRLVLECSSQ